MVPSCSSSTPTTTDWKASSLTTLCPRRDNPASISSKYQKLNRCITANLHFPKIQILESLLYQYVLHKQLPLASTGDEFACYQWLLSSLSSATDCSLLTEHEIKQWISKCTVYNSHQGNRSDDLCSTSSSYDQFDFAIVTHYKI